MPTPTAIIGGLAVVAWLGWPAMAGPEKAIQQGQTTPPSAQAVPPNLLAEFSGTWACDSCPAGVAEPFGQRFKLTASQISIVIETATTPVVTRTFYFSGLSVPTAVWEGMHVLLTQTTFVDATPPSFSGPVVERFVLTVISDGPTAGRLQIQLGASPSSQPGGVTTYKKISSRADLTSHAEG